MAKERTEDKPRWYQVHKKINRKLQERSERKAQDRKRYVGQGYFLNYVTDEFISRPFYWPFMIIPEGYGGIRRRLGRVGRAAKYKYPQRDENAASKDPYFETDDRGRPIEVIDRDFPWSGVERPGFKFVLTLGGLLDTIAVVDMRTRTRELELEHVLTKGGTEVRVGVALNYRIVDSVRALTGAENYGVTVRERAEAAVRESIVRRNIDDLESLRGRELNLAGEIKEDPVLHTAGLKIEDIRITKFDIPDNMAQALAAEEIARSQARGTVERARGDLAAAQLHAQAGRFYDAVPGAREVLHTTTGGREGNEFRYEPHIGKIADAISRIAAAILGRRNP